MSIINSWQNDKDVKKFYDMVKQSAPKLNKAPETIKDKSLTYYIIDIMVDYYEEGKLDNEQEILAQIELIKNIFSK